jgi:hypothetical protein
MPIKKSLKKRSKRTSRRRSKRTSRRRSKRTSRRRSKRTSRRRSKRTSRRRVSRKRTSKRRSRKRVSRKQQGGTTFIKKIKDFFYPLKQDNTPEETPTAPTTAPQTAPTTAPKYGSTEYAYGFIDDGNVPKTLQEILKDPNDPKNKRSTAALSGLAIELEYTGGDSHLGPR